MKRIKRNDEVIVIAGRDKGRRGTVLRVLSKANKVVVANVNKVKKHQKGNPQTGSTSGIVELEKPLHMSNVALYNPDTGKADRVGVRTLEDGRKVRYFKSTNEIVEL
ncbi:MAG: 50S ribosomal protein L24 [Nitrococcus sp.]|nr:50S ribosomal protein L24 [Nitrococcus sp.]